MMDFIVLLGKRLFFILCDCLESKGIIVVNGHNYSKSAVQSFLFVSCVLRKISCGEARKNNVWFFLSRQRHCIINDL
jgi:hypothetical protein